MLSPMNTCEYVLIHHSVVQNPVQFDIVNESHRKRGFPKSSLGYYVGYHYFIGMDGTIKVARAEWEIGAHCAAKMMNYRAIGICLAGDFREGRTPNPEQIKSLALLLKDIQARHQMFSSKIMRHGEVKATACPGEWDFKKEVVAYWARPDHPVNVLQGNFTEAQREYDIATTIPKQNRAQRILNRIKKAAVKASIVLR